jgi:hypothetical protein
MNTSQMSPPSFDLQIPGRLPSGLSTLHFWRAMLIETSTLSSSSPLRLFYYQSPG